jgi:pilus assembly protein CpaF
VNTQQRDYFLTLIASHLRPLKPYFEDPAVVEIMCNGGGEVWIEARGQMTRADVTISDEAVVSAVLAIAGQAGRAAEGGSESGIVDAEIPLSALSDVQHDGHANVRLAAVLAPTALRGHALCMRKHSPVIYSLEQYESDGCFSKVNRSKVGASKNLPFTPEQIAQGGPVLRELLVWMAKNKKTILLSGSTGSGKTTLFKTLIQQIPATERLITIEDTPELVVASPNFVSLHSNSQKGVTPQLLVKLGMRMRPDRLVLGELRDETALNFLEAANTGHPGSIASLHANDALSALTRLESLALQFYRSGSPPIASIRHRILSTIDFVIQVGKDGRPGVIEEILQVNYGESAIEGYSAHSHILFSRYESS